MHSGEDGLCRKAVKSFRLDRCVILHGLDYRLTDAVTHASVASLTHYHKSLFMEFVNLLFETEEAYLADFQCHGHFSCRSSAVARLLKNRCKKCRLKGSD